MLSVYPACFYEEENGAYSVIFPDLNHLATCGGDLTEAMSMAVDCLAGYLHSAMLEKEVVPAPSDISAVRLDEEESCRKAFVNLVSVDVEEYAGRHFNKAVKKTLTIPSWLNDMAVRKGINFSATLQEALKERLDL